MKSVKMVDGSGDIQCYACEHSYWYIGKKVHLGRCPKCDSYCVSQAGELSILTSTVTTKQTDTEVIVLAIDQRRRHYLYQYIHSRKGCELTTLNVEGNIIRTTNTGIPNAIAEEIQEHRQRPQPEEA